MSRRIIYDHNNDGINRRGIGVHGLAGTGVIWTVSGGVLSSQAFGNNNPRVWLRGVYGRARPAVYLALSIRMPSGLRHITWDAARAG
ncbi:MAG TPA: hypothetical protein VGP62_18160 [Bryobacteraceae bacterium]|nr:hypothetical protein [Bryobacteraceae bacterium]